MKKLALSITEFSIRAPKVVAAMMALSTLALVFLALAPTLAPETFSFLNPATVDTDPENMLSADEPARLAHNAHKKRFNLHDAIVVGVVDEHAKEGVFTPDTLRRVHELTNYAKGLEGVIGSDVMSPSTVDDMTNAGAGVVKFDYLMPNPPKTIEEAAKLSERIKRQPFLDGTLVSEDGKALAIYVPLEEKHMAREITEALRIKIEQMDEEKAGSAEWHFAGLPVAEDTFGLEMFKQMAIGAPAAMLVIFLLMWVFFRKVIVIVSPMLVAMAAALSTMGLLIATGNTVHIMSSMIPIFIMPIAVLDAIHIISDFFDRYQETRDRATTIRHVMADLFSPMLFTSLTTTAGFASLALTPIPPVQVFGFFVAAGVLAAWFWTITFIPAFIMLIPERMLENFGRKADASKDLGKIANFTANFTSRRAGWVLTGAGALVALAAYGISLININDNPVRWFEADHPVRVADRVLNQHFGGTYDAYLTFNAKDAEYAPEAYGQSLSGAADARTTTLRSVFKAVQTEATKPATFAGSTDPMTGLDRLDAFARTERKATKNPAERAAWLAAGDFIGDEMTRAEELADAGGTPPPFDAATFSIELAHLADARLKSLTGELSTFKTAVAAIASTKPESAEAFRTALAPRTNSVNAKAILGEAAQSGQVFKDPKVLAWLGELQVALVESGSVGKSNSLTDIVKSIHRDLVSGKEIDHRIPDNSAMVAQTLEQFLSSHRKDDLWHFTTPNFDAGVLWMQLRSGDNTDMQKTIAFANDWVKNNPPPVAMEDPSWSGLSYINVVWQEKMVSGMMDAFLGSFVIVLVMMIFLFRSVLWGLFSMIPLTVTVGMIYGATGLLGKDYDMPVAVLSSLSLGLAIDYAIHFLARARELRDEMGSWEAAKRAVFAEPARAISRNVVVVGVGFLPLLAAPLVPYQTVGLLIASILILAGAASLLILPALITLFEPWLFKKPATKKAPDSQGPSSADLASN